LCFGREWRACRAGGGKWGDLPLSAGPEADKRDAGEDARVVRADAFRAQIWGRNGCARTRSDRVVYLGQAVGLPFAHFSVRADAFGRGVVVFVDLLEMPLKQWVSSV
jgi:hypothetical protein